MKKLYLVAICLLLFSVQAFAQGSGPVTTKWEKVSGYIINKTADSIGFYITGSETQDDTLWYSFRGFDSLVVDGIGFPDSATATDDYVIKINTATGNFYWAEDIGAGGALTYWTEADAGDTSQFTATGPNTLMQLNGATSIDGNLNMLGNNITNALNLSSNSPNALTVSTGDNADSLLLQGNSTGPIILGRVGTEGFTYHYDTLKGYDGTTEDKSVSADLDNDADLTRFTVGSQDGGGETIDGGIGHYWTLSPR